MSRRSPRPRVSSLQCLFRLFTILFYIFISWSFLKNNNLANNTKCHDLPVLIQASLKFILKKIKLNCICWLRISTLIDLLVLRAALTMPLRNTSLSFDLRPKFWAPPVTLINKFGLLNFQQSNNTLVICSLLVFWPTRMNF